VTPEQEALVEKLLDLFVRKVPVRKSLCLAEAGLVSHRRLSEEEERAALEGKITPHVLTNVGMFELTPTDSGELVLAVAAERDLWRLKAEWQEARAESFAAQLEYAELNPEESREKVSAEVLDEADDRMMLAAEKRDAARAAYLAAGGEE